MVLRTNGYVEVDKSKTATFIEPFAVDWDR